MKKHILLSFDTEEFDLPIEYKQSISDDLQLEITKNGLLKVETLLNKLNIKATFFVTAYFAKKHSEIIKRLAKTHEIASHGYYHSKFKTEDLLTSKTELERIIEKKVYGFRMPRLASVNFEAIANAGYAYDSSINPTYLPGRYNHLNESTKPHFKGGLFELPISVTTKMRFPLFWLSFKNLKFSIYKRLFSNSLNHFGFINIYFHPWEFTDALKNYKLPFYLKKCHGKALETKLEKLVKFCKNENADFLTCNAFRLKNYK